MHQRFAEQKLMGLYVTVAILMDAKTLKSEQETLSSSDFLVEHLHHAGSSLAAKFELTWR